MTAARAVKAKPKAPVVLGRCSFGWGKPPKGTSWTPDDACACGRYRERELGLDVCVCGHSDLYHHEVERPMNVAEAIAKFRHRVERALDRLSSDVEHVLSEVDDRKRYVRELEEAGMLSPEDAVAVRTNGKVTAEEVREIAREFTQVRSDSDSTPARALKTTLLAFGACTKQTLLVRAVYSHTTKSVQAALKQIHDEGFVRYADDGRIFVMASQTEDVVSKARSLSVPLGTPLLEAWCRKLDAPGEACLRALAERYPLWLSKAEIADVSGQHGGPEGGYSLTTKSFHAALRRLRLLSLASYDEDEEWFRCHPDLVAESRRVV